MIAVLAKIKILYFPWFRGFVSTDVQLSPANRQCFRLVFFCWSFLLFYKSLNRKSERKLIRTRRRSDWADQLAAWERKEPPNSGRVQSGLQDRVGSFVVSGGYGNQTKFWSDRVLATADLVQFDSLLGIEWLSVESLLSTDHFSKFFYLSTLHSFKVQAVSFIFQLSREYNKSFLLNKLNEAEPMKFNTKACSRQTAGR